MSTLNIQSAVRHLTRHIRRGTRAVQFSIFVLAGVTAFLLRFDFIVPPAFRVHLLAGIGVWAAVKVLVFHFFKLDRGWWRYVSINDLRRGEPRRIRSRLPRSPLAYPPGFSALRLFPGLPALLWDDRGGSHGSAAGVRIC